MGSLSSTLKRKMLRLPLSKSHLCYGDGRAAPRTYRNDAPTQWTMGQGGIATRHDRLRLNRSKILSPSGLHDPLRAHRLEAVVHLARRHPSDPSVMLPRTRTKEFGPGRTSQEERLTLLGEGGLRSRPKWARLRQDRNGQPAGFRTARSVVRPRDTLIRSPKGSRDGVSTSVEPHVGKALVNLAARYGTSRTTE